MGDQINQMMKISEITRVNSFYTIVSGLFRYDPGHADETQVWEMYVNWRERINGGNYHATFDYLNHSYYDSYLNNIYPEIRFSEDHIHSLSSRVLNHLTLKKCLGEHAAFGDLELEMHDGSNIGFRIEHIDLYHFPHEIGIFTMKVSLTSGNTLGVISSFMNGIRHLESDILDQDGSRIKLKDLIRGEILAPLHVTERWTVFNPQLKLYTMIDLESAESQEQLDDILYDIGNLAPIGSAGGDTLFTPSITYFNDQMQNHRISVFRNWTALALYDTFTRVSINYKDNFNTWENDYFNLYIHTIYSKFFMYLTNSELSDVTRVDKRTERIRDRFIEFINDYQHVQISYKFLPDLIRDKLIYALGIHAEVESMDLKIQRINEQLQEKREKSFNTALVVITLLSVISVIYDLSEWMVRVGIDRSRVYPVPSILSGLIIFGLIFLIFRIRRK